eukprot:PhM_4_TR10056/c8_g1_i2/m.42457
MANITRVLQHARSKVPIVASDTVLAIYIISRGAFGTCNGLSGRDAHIVLAADTIVNKMTSKTCLVVEHLAAEKDEAGHRPVLFVDAWAMPAAPFATTVPALGFGWVGGRTAGVCELTSLYARHIPGGLLTFYFMKGCSGKCVLAMRQHLEKTAALEAAAAAAADEQHSPVHNKNKRNSFSKESKKEKEAAEAMLDDKVVTTANIVAYLGSKLQPHSDCVCRFTLVGSLALFPEYNFPTYDELKDKKLAMMEKRVRFTIVLNARCGDSAAPSGFATHKGQLGSANNGQPHNAFGYDSQYPNVWKSFLWRFLLRTLCGVSDASSFLSTAFPYCPLRVAFLLERGASFQARFKDLSECIRDEALLKKLDAEIGKALAATRPTLLSKTSATRAPWYYMYTTENTVEFVCHEQNEMQRALRSYVTNTTFSRPISNVYVQLEAVVSGTEYVVYKLDKMMRLGAFQKFMPIVEIKPDPFAESLHDAAAHIQAKVRGLREKKRFERQRAILRGEEDTRSRICHHAARERDEILRDAKRERFSVFVHWEENFRSEISSWGRQELRRILGTFLKDLQHIEETLRARIMRKHSEDNHMLNERSQRVTWMSMEERDRRFLRQRERIQLQQHWDRYYVRIQEYQYFLAIRNLARFKTRVQLKPPMKPIQPALIAVARGGDKNYDEVTKSAATISSKRGAGNNNNNSNNNNNNRPVHPSQLPLNFPNSMEHHRSKAKFRELHLSSLMKSKAVRTRKGSEASSPVPSRKVSTAFNIAAAEVGNYNNNNTSGGGGGGASPRLFRKQSLHHTAATGHRKFSNFSNNSPGSEHRSPR